MPICEFSGEDTDRLVTVKIEGVTMRVAPKYAKYGTRVDEAAPARRVAREKSRARERTERVRSDAAKIIRDAFHKLDVEEKDFAKRIGMKESTFKSYLRGDLAIPIADAKTLEKTLHVSIVEASAEPAAEETTKSYVSDSPSGGLTLGDMIKRSKR